MSYYFLAIWDIGGSICLIFSALILILKKQRLKSSDAIDNEKIEQLVINESIIEKLGSPPA
jgi:hypothetical protein